MKELSPVPVITKTFNGKYWEYWAIKPYQISVQKVIKSQDAISQLTEESIPIIPIGPITDLNLPLIPFIMKNLVYFLIPHYYLLKNK